MPGSSRTNNLSFEVVNGAPAAAFLFEDMDIGGTDHFGVSYLSASDADGTAWGAAVVVDSVPSTETGYMRMVQIIDLAGLPGVGYMMEVYTDETQSISWFCCAGDSQGAAWGTPDVIFGPGHESAAEGDKLKFLSVFPIVIAEGTVVGAIPILNDVDGNNTGELWCAPVAPEGGLDWSEDAVLMADFIENRETSSLQVTGYSDGKQVSCASYSLADCMTIAGASYVYLMLLACGYDESYAICLTYIMGWSLQLQMIAALLL